MAIEALDIILDEKLAENSAELGLVMRKRLDRLNKKVIKEVRGKGLLHAIEINTGNIHTSNHINIYV